MNVTKIKQGPPLLVFLFLNKWTCQQHVVFQFRPNVCFLKSIEGDFILLFVKCLRYGSYHTCTYVI